MGILQRFWSNKGRKKEEKKTELTRNLPVTLDGNIVRWGDNNYAALKDFSDWEIQFLIDGPIIDVPSELSGDDVLDLIRPLLPRLVALAVIHDKRKSQDDNFIFGLCATKLALHYAVANNVSFETAIKRVTG